MGTVNLTYTSQNDVAAAFDADATATGAMSDETELALTATTTPAVTKFGKAVVTLSGTTGTIDLTALACLDGRTVDLTGLKVRTWKVSRPAADTHDLTIAKGASNGYTGFGSAYSETIHKLGEKQSYDGGNGVAVSGSVKTLDISGTSGESLLISFTAGA